MSGPVAVAHRIFRAAGVDLVRYPGRTSPIGRRMRLLRSLGVDLVIDIGANEGQYARELRRLGFRGYIVSYEPQAAPFAILARSAAADKHWDTRNLALGSEPSRLALNLAGNSVSSSFLEMLPAHLDAAPGSAFVGRETVEVTTLDDAWSALAALGSRPYLKLDVQGYEWQVLAGARAMLGQMAALQVELSLVPLYASSLGFTGHVDALAERGFELASVEPGFEDPRTGRLLQLDGVFVRRDLLGRE